MAFKVILSFLSVAILLASTQNLPIHRNMVYSYGLTETQAETVIKSNFTHLILSFVEICFGNNPQGEAGCIANPNLQLTVTLNLESVSNLNSSFFETLKSIQLSGKKVMVSLGGWGSTTWQAIQGNEQAAAAVLANFVQQEGLDGVDLDFESTNPNMTSFGLFGKFLRQALPNNIILSIVPIAMRSGVGGGLNGQWEALQNNGVTPDYVNLQLYQGGYQPHNDVVGYIENNITNPNIYPNFEMNRITVGYMAATPYVLDKRDLNCNYAEGYSKCIKMTCQLSQKYSDFGGVFTWALGNLPTVGVQWDQVMDDAMNRQSYCAKQIHDFVDEQILKII